MRLILFAIFIYGGFKVMFGDPVVIQETVTRILFCGGALLVVLFGLGILKEAIKG